MKAPNLAILIGKKPSNSGSSPSASQHADDLGSDKETQEDSAVSDMLDAAKSNDVSSFKSALKDFLEICYPSLSDDDEDDDKDEEEPKEESEEPEDY